jgi:hypothetical protein
MRQFKLSSSGLEDLLAMYDCDVIEYFEGCLLDNEVYEMCGGYLFCYESYVNPNMSEYECKFAREYDKACDELWAEWYRRERAALEVEA